MGKGSNLLLHNQKKIYIPDLWSEIMLFDSIKSVITSKKSVIVSG